MKKVAGYIRVSSKQQVNEGQSLKDQEQEIKAYCKKNRLKLVRIYADKGISGAALEGRLELEKMLIDSSSGEFDTVVITKLDRLGREQYITLWIQKELLTKDVELFSIAEPYKWDNPMDKLMLQMVASFAEFEKNRLMARLNAGKQKKKEKGGFIGGRVPLGFDNVEGQLIVNEKEAEIIKKIFNNRQSGKSFYRISKMLNESGYKTKFGKNFSHQTIEVIVKNKGTYKPILKGYVNAN